MASPSSSPFTQNAAAPLAAALQLLVVTAPAWGSTAGQLLRFARAERDGAWQAVGAALSVSLGRNGMAWGRGLHLPMSGVEKVEGDGCAPAGIFAVTALFGVAPADSPLARAAKLPYLPATPDLKAIDDPASAYYNRIERYAVGAVVAHNAGPVVPGAGSCIFLHVRAGEGVPTAGCTAMALADVMALAAWLDGAAKPLLVQLPQAEYDARRAAWGLPALTTCGDSSRSAG